VTITWERNVNEIVWESQTAPGITWTTVVGGTGGTEIPGWRPFDVAFVLVEPGTTFNPTTDAVQMAGAAYLFRGTEPNGDPDEGWEPWEHTGLWQGTSTVDNPVSVMTRIQYELKAGDAFLGHALINLKELIDPPAARTYQPYGSDFVTSRIGFIPTIVVGDEQVGSVDNPKFIMLNEHSQPGFVQGQWKPRVLSANGEVNQFDKVIYADTTDGDITLDASQMVDEPDTFRDIGRLVVVKNIGTGSLTITGIGSLAPLGAGQSMWLHVTEDGVEVLATNGGGGELPSDLVRTSDMVSALATKADLASPALTGNPTAPTQTVGDNSTRIATTAFVAAAAALKMSTASAPLRLRSRWRMLLRRSVTRSPTSPHHRHQPRCGQRS
jgi:hypothetical protein